MYMRPLPRRPPRSVDFFTRTAQFGGADTIDPPPPATDALSTYTRSADPSVPNDTLVAVSDTVESMMLLREPGSVHAA
jgi:hypothetical protein